MISANIDRDIRRAVYQRDGWRCVLCDSTKYIQIHHGIPKSRGGDPESMHNLVTLCSDCHALAHGTDLRDTGITKKETEQAIVEYLADYYAIEGWQPYTQTWWQKHGFTCR